MCGRWFICCLSAEDDYGRIENGSPVAPGRFASVPPAYVCLRLAHPPATILSGYVAESLIGFRSISLIFFQTDEMSCNPATSPRVMIKCLAVE